MLIKLMYIKYYGFKSFDPMKKFLGPKYLVNQVFNFFKLLI